MESSNILHVIENATSVIALTSSAESETSLGVFAMLATMMAIIAGSTGIRMVFIDKAYRYIIKSTEDENSISTSDDDSSSNDTMSLAQRLADIHAKRASNKRGVIVDGFGILIILVVGFLAALDLIPHPFITVGIPIMFFLSTMIPFYIHAQAVLNQSA